MSDPCMLDDSNDEEDADDGFGVVTVGFADGDEDTEEENIQVSAVDVGEKGYKGEPHVK